MTVLSKTAALVAFAGLSVGAGAPAWAEQSHYVSSNAVDKCQAFTPGVTNTIRNRVAGAQNIGSQPIAVACVFEVSETYGLGSPTVDDAYVYIRNDAAAQVTVNCSLLPGDPSNLGTIITRSVTLAPGETGSVGYGSNEGDADAPWSVFGIGVNCNLPPQATITQTILRYRNDS